MEILLAIVAIFFLYKWLSAKKETNEARILGLHREWFVSAGIDPDSVRYATYTGRPYSLTDCGVVYIGDGKISNGNRVGFAFEATQFGIAGEQIYSWQTTSWHKKFSLDSLQKGVPMQTFLDAMENSLNTKKSNP